MLRYYKVRAWMGRITNAWLAKMGRITNAWLAKMVRITNAWLAKMGRITNAWFAKMERITNACLAKSIIYISYDYKRPKTLRVIKHACTYMLSTSILSICCGRRSWCDPQSTWSVTNGHKMP